MRVCGLQALRGALRAFIGGYERVCAFLCVDQCVHGRAAGAPFVAPPPTPHWHAHAVFLPGRQPRRQARRVVPYRDVPTVRWGACSPSVVAFRGGRDLHGACATSHARRKKRGQPAAGRYSVPARPLRAPSQCRPTPRVLAVGLWWCAQKATRVYTDAVLVADVSTAVPAASVSVDGVLQLSQRGALAAATGQRWVKGRPCAMWAVAAHGSPRLSCMPAYILPRVIAAAHALVFAPLAVVCLFAPRLACCCPTRCCSLTHLSSEPALPLASAMGVEDLDVASIVAAYNSRNGARAPPPSPSHPRHPGRCRGRGLRSWCSLCEGATLTVWLWQLPPIWRSAPPCGGRIPPRAA
jgi:hypothetical protein